MRAMKDSGIEWIGEIPEGWTIKRIKYLANKEKYSFVDGDWIDSPNIVSDGIRYLTSGNIGDGSFKEQGDGYISQDTFENLNCTAAFPNDLVFSRLNSPYGRSCILPSHQDMYVLAVDNVILRTEENKKFLCYVTQCRGYQKVVEDSANGTAMKRISRTDLGNVFLPIAGIDEQTRIADYLDKKCGEIDVLIAEKEKSNELLKEHRQSVIYEAVTKGLDKNAKMKDSGVEWIGEIPEGWRKNRIKNVAVFFNGDRSSNYPSGNDLMDEGIIFLTSNNIHGKYVEADDTSKYISEEKYSSLGGAKIGINDIIFCLRGSIGTCAINKRFTKGTVASSLVAIRPNGINPDFLNYLLSSDLVNNQTNEKSNGTCAANLSAENVAGYVFVEPSIEEQAQISDYLDKRCSEIDSIIKSNESTIEKLKEYRQSVIYEAVTGKVEV